MMFKFAVQHASVQNTMNVNVLAPTEVLSRPSDQQQAPSDFQPSVNISPINAVTQPTEVSHIENLSNIGNQHQITADEIRPASLLNQDQVNASASGNKKFELISET